MHTHWNHRVIKQVFNGEAYYGIHEVHYEGDKPVAYSERPSTIEWYAVNLDAPEWIIDKFKQALEKSTLTLEDFK